MWLILLLTTLIYLCGVIDRHTTIYYDMVIYMKTTVHIPDSLFKEARKVAQEEQTTLKALIERGLRKVISERKQRKRFKLRMATFKGHGLQPHIAGASWDKLRDISYEGRGG